MDFSEISSGANSTGGIVNAQLDISDPSNNDEDQIKIEYEEPKNGIAPGLISMVERLIGQQQQTDNHCETSASNATIVYNNISNVQLSNVIMNANSSSTIGDVNMSNRSTTNDHESATKAEFKNKSQLFGSMIRHKKTLPSVVISWKCGSFFGIGGDRSERYNVMIYSLSANGAEIDVFVHHSMTIPQSTVIDSRFQYGCQNGDLFLVLHDKAKHRPYQHRFVANKNVAFNAANEAIQSMGFDLSFLVGDYLRDF